MTESMDDWLAAGGGAVAALNLAVGAALVSRVCEHEAAMAETRAWADECRLAAEALVRESAAAAEEVRAACRLPEDEPTRAAAIQHAVRGAAAVPLKVAERAAKVVEVAAQVLDGVNVQVVHDVAAAASSARAALHTARINVETNLANLSKIVRADLEARLASCHVDAIAARADALVDAARSRITPNAPC